MMNPYTPTDAVILAMMKAGTVTVPDMSYKLFGPLDPELGLSARNKILRKLKQMEKYGIVKRTGEYQLRNPGNAAIIWKVA